ncbi:hypothetical protein LOTGIDRAFT_228968 [Lottia gigantea]|uniref:SoHo domain-containing protein n=1 Tax=Lottia gigantea TaxID=225164 RepID=V4A6Y5_LOTGI|nr:hypothetical protein LOTGIDRAFT_228968 [Lottia gigantea]ESO89031.1 hypothetical protein LOTGIDRAFT_228968 [Lottia gigantea]
MLQQWGTSKKDKTVLPKPVVNFDVILPGPDSTASRLSPRLSPAGSRSRRMMQAQYSGEIKVDHPNQFSQPPQPGQMAVPYYTPSRHAGRPVPQKDSHERNVPITVLSPQQNRNRSYSESDPYGFNIGQVLEPERQPWRAGPSEPPKPNYGSAGSYATLPVKRAAKQQPVVKKASDTNAIQHNDQRYDFNMYSTLPTIKPLKSTQKIDTSDSYKQNQSFDYSQPLWTNQETPRVSSSFPKSQQGAFGDSTPSASSTLTSSDSHDTIVSGTSSKDFRKPINVIHEEMKPIQVVHEERAPSKPIKYTYQDFMKPQRAVREDFKQEPQEEFIKPQKVVREESKPRARQPIQPSGPAEVQEEMIVPQKKEDVQMYKRAPDFGSLPKTKSPNQKKDIGTFHTLPSKSSSSPSAKPTAPVVNGNVTSHHTLGPLSPTSSKQGVWSPGTKPSTFVKAAPEISPRPVQPEPSFNVKPVWTPGGSPSGARKEFKPVKLNTNVSYKPVEKPKPKPKVISPSVRPDDGFSWQPPDSPSSRDPTKLPTSAVQYQLASSKLESLLPEAIENAPPMNGLDTSFDSTKDDLHLPQTQSPYITLLQKSREIEQLSDISNIKQPVMVMDEGQFPKGAKYIGKVERVEGDQKHTDTYYTTKTVEEEASSKVIEQKPKIFDGIGPVDQEGVPLAFRKNIDEKNQHAWYRQMYKNLHKTEKKDELLGINDIIDSIFEDAEDNDYTPTYRFPEEISDTRSEEEVNPYRPSYEIPSRFIDDAGYRSEPEGKSKNLFKNRSKSTSSDESRRLYNYPPPNVQSKIEVYRNQPRSIMEYEPGFSSLAFQEAKTKSPEVRQRSHSVHSTPPRKFKVHNPPADKPGQFSN